MAPAVITPEKDCYNTPSSNMISVSMHEVDQHMMTPGSTEPATPTYAPKSWVYISGLGERNMSHVSESDVLTAIKFNQTGEYLAVGD